MTPDQKLLEELTRDVQRLTYDEKLALREFIDALDRVRQAQVATFVHTTMGQLVNSPPPIPGAENKTPVKRNLLRGEPLP
jgi:hypothetical protein